MPPTDYTAFKDATEIPNSLVEELRDRFLEEVAKNPDLYYQQDIDRIKSSDWPLQRFLLVRKNKVEDALKSLINAMQWRKSYGVLEINDQDFPREIYQCGYAIIYGTDINGAPVVILRGNINKKIKSWVPVMKKFFIYQIEKIDAQNNGKGLTLVMDCKGAGVKNVDSDALQFTTQVFKEYYPRLIAATLIHKLPAVLETIHKLVQSWLSEDERRYLHLTNKKNINEFIPKEQLPDFLLGTNNQPYRIVPSNAPSAAELAHKLGLKEGKADKFVKHFEQYFNA